MEKLTREKIEQVLSAMSGQGDDYPRRVQVLKKVGVKSYIFHIKNARNVYYDHNGESVEMAYPDRLSPVEVSDTVSREGLEQVIRDHQKGKTDFATFREQAAGAGVNSWTANLENMEVIYYDINNHKIVSEPIPEAIS